MRASRSTAMTLPEVLLAIVLVAIGVLTIALYLPTALRLHERARFQAYAAAKVNDVAEVLANLPMAQSPQYFDAEATQPWDVPASYRAFHPDLELRAAAPRNGIAAVPREIAYRLDSDRDEIRRHLDAGGALYYSQPLAANGLRADSTHNIKPPSDARKLVFAVLGAAQSNSITYLPWKGAPYRVNYPSPPAHGLLNFGYNTNLPSGYRLWEHGEDPDISFVSTATVPAPARSTGYWPYLQNQKTGSTGDQSDRARSYVAVAWWYACRKGVPVELLAATADDAWVDTWMTGVTAGREHLKVHALRILAHAALCLTRWHQLDDGEGLGLRGGVAVPGLQGAAPGTPMTLAALLASAPTGGTATPLDPPPERTGAQAGMLYVDHETIARWHEYCLRAGTRYAAEVPEDWRFLRPSNRMIMTDHPLVEYDLIDTGTSPLLSGTVTGHGAAARQWRPVAAYDDIQAGTNLARASVDWSAIRGDIRHFTLTAPFAASERCRQMVFWSVDWQSYEDFETARSFPVDASRYPKASPLTMNGTFVQLMGRDMTSQNDVGFLSFYDIYQPQFRNPEKAMAFFRDVSALPTGAYVRNVTLAHDVSENDPGVQDRIHSVRRLDQGYTGSGPLADRRESAFSGINGADRNYNQYLDRGSLRPSVRLRAMEVARYNVYDPRLTMSFR